MRTSSSAAPRRLLAVLVAACALTLLAGCGLPLSSGVQAGRPVGENLAPRARIVVDPPSPGASQDVIARDFIRAGAAFQDVDDTQQVVGRSYLAPGSVDRWRPTALTTTVYDARDPLTVEHLPSDQVRLTITAVATIDDTGHYRELPPGTKARADFAMVKVDGQWRIQLGENGFGLWLNTDDFDRVFGAYSVNYVLGGGRFLIPDVRWFPTGARLATELARAQLEQVPAYLQGVASTGVPSGTRLAVDAVDVDATGVATVTLTNGAQAVDPTRRRAIWAQYLATLTQVPGVAAVSIEVQGLGKIPVSNVPGPVSGIEELGFAAPPTSVVTVALARSGEQLRQVDLQDLDDRDRAGAQPTRAAKAVAQLPRIPQAYTDLAASADGSDIAGVATSRSELVRWRGSTAVVYPSFGTDLTKPQYGVDGRLWFAGTANNSGSRVWTVDASSLQPTRPAALNVPWLSGRQVLAVSISPEGSRLAVVSRLPNGTDSRLDVAGIVRAADGTPTALASPYRQGEPLVGFVDVTWLDASTMAVLAQVSAGDQLRPFQVDLGQGVGLRRVGSAGVDQSLITQTPAAHSITSRGGIRGLIVTTGAGVLVRTGNAWAPQQNVSQIVIGGV